ncbi:MAG: PilN domain-containing protein [Bacteriovoracaceae bacterium]|nr:PilN domain-containing protein [Bacteriovoracaceae bacterium]
MIELNLIEVKASQVAGLGPLFEVIKAINWIAVAIAGAIYFGGEWFLQDQWTKDKQAKEEEINELTQQINKYKKDIRKNRDLKEMKEAFEKQAETLKSRSSQIDEILQLKINPQRILERIAHDVPDTVWLSSIELNPNKTAIIQGEALDYKSIGDFMAKLNESKFFNRSLKLKDSSTIEISVNDLKRRVEKFTLDGTISAYE